MLFIFKKDNFLKQLSTVDFSIWGLFSASDYYTFCVKWGVVFLGLSQNKMPMLKIIKVVPRRGFTIGQQWRSRVQWNKMFHALAAHIRKVIVLVNKQDFKI